MLVTSDDDPSASKSSAPIRPCWCRLRMESAMMRAVFFWYPPDVTMRMGMPRRFAALNTISSLFTMPWQREKREKLACQSRHSQTHYKHFLSIHCSSPEKGGEAVPISHWFTVEQCGKKHTSMFVFELRAGTAHIKNLIDFLVHRGILHITRHKRNTCSTKILNNNYLRCTYQDYLY